MVEISSDPALERLGGEGVPSMTDSDALLSEVTASLGGPCSATYRFQLGPALGFEEVRALVPYLEALGITDVYLSPCFRCGPGSSHGYDVLSRHAWPPSRAAARLLDFTRQLIRLRLDHPVSAAASSSKAVAFTARPSRIARGSVPTARR
jgi:hypothetical protein